MVLGLTHWGEAMSPFLIQKWILQTSLITKGTEIGALLPAQGLLRSNRKYLVKPVIIEHVLLLTAVSGSMKGSDGGPHDSIPNLCIETINQCAV